MGKFMNFGWWAQDPHPASHGEKLLSSLGALFGILGVMLVSRTFMDPHSAMLVVASMGASTVLLFAVPHSPLSQPWPVFGGHVLSAAVGVSTVSLIQDPLLAAPVAVALAVGVMYYTRCLHPPGGATALAFVLGSDQLHAMGFAFLVTPVLINVLVLLGVAIFFNAPFEKRRYPLGLKKLASNQTVAPASAMAGEKLVIAHSDLVYALSQIDTFIDISEEDLLEIYRLATQHAHVDDVAHAHGGFQPVSVPS